MSDDWNDVTAFWVAVVIFIGAVVAVVHDQMNHLDWCAHHTGHEADRFCMGD